MNRTTDITFSAGHVIYPKIMVHSVGMVAGG